VPADAVSVTPTRVVPKMLGSAVLTGAAGVGLGLGEGEPEHDAVVAEMVAVVEASPPPRNVLAPSVYALPQERPVNLYEKSFVLAM
jgi:hypothetical protein